MPCGEAFFEYSTMTRRVHHKILKSGCKAEELRLRTADRLANLIAVFCVVSWRIFWITMVHRAGPLTRYIIKLTQLADYLARANDPHLGNTVTLRGLRRLIDIQIGFELAENCG